MITKSCLILSQIGTVVEGAADFYSGRIVKSKRRKTLVDELLADAEFKNYQKKKYKEIMNLDIRKRRAQSKMPQKQNAIEKQAKKQGKVKKKTKD